MSCDQANELEFAKQIIYLFPIVFATLQLPVSLEQIDPIWMESIVRGSFGNDVHNKTWIWPTSDSFCLITLHTGTNLKIGEVFPSHQCIPS